MTTAPQPGPDLLRNSARTTWRVTRGLVAVPARLTRDVAELPRSALRAVASAEIGQGLGRQIWAAGGRAVIEVRGLDRDDVDRRTAAAAVERALARAEGVRSARIDAATSRVAIRFEPGRHTLADLIEAVAAAEAAALGGDDPLDDVGDEVLDLAERLSPASPLPDDDAAVTRATVTAAVTVVAAAATAAARMAGLPRLPASAAALLALVEHQPWVRDRLEDALGADRTELLLALANAVLNGLTQNLLTLLLDSVSRGSRLRAATARRDGHEARREELLGPGRPPLVAATARDERPVALPPGPVERLARRTAPLSLGASAALLATTGNPTLAGRAVLVGVPRAAHAARIGFADALGSGLARRGVLLVDPTVLTRLDRVTTVIVQSSVLHGPRGLVLSALGHADGWTDARVWRAGQRMLDAEHDGGPVPAGRALVARGPDRAGDGDQMHGDGARDLLVDGRPVGEVLVGRELDPLADAVLAAVREAGLRLVLTADPATDELAGRADEVLHDGSRDPLELRAEVRRLQAGGEVVALTGTDPEALDAADVGIGVVPAEGPVPWAADLVCGPGLTEVPRLVAAMPRARSAATRGVRVAVGSSALGALLLAVGPRGGRGAPLPVTMGALGALLSGWRAGQRVLRRPDPVPLLHVPWHALEPEETLARLPDPGPVAAADEGEPTAGPARRALRLVRELADGVRAELDDPLTPVLATGSAASAVIGSPTDSLLVGGVLTGSAVISAAQRLRAERALRDLLLDQRLPARLVPAGDDGARGGGTPRTVPAMALRPGHLLELRAGDVVPTDARLVSASELELDEATLTGESTPVVKETVATPGAELPDRTGMVYEGTTVVAGSGRAVVVATGPATEAGRAMALAGRAAGPAGMQSRLEELTRRGLPVTLLGGAGVTALALLRGGSLRSAIASGVSVAVAAVPEGLPLMATVAQLGAARRLSRRGVLVRSSRTVEALGRVDTICFDKTGTLTQARLRLVRVAALDGERDLAGREGRRLLREAAHAGPAPDGDRALPHATDQAVLDSARAVLGEELGASWEELVEVPFHSERGYSAVVGRTGRKVRLVVKGAPEVLLPRCAAVRDDTGKHPLDDRRREQAQETVRALAGQGLRVLAVARRNVGDVADRLDSPEDVVERGDLTLLGFLGLADEPRPHAAATVAALREAGVGTVMITGDHPVTARAIAGSLGIPTEHLLTGPELASLDERARTARVAATSVFARVSPEQKLHIVQALQASGRVVAMTGDGANDAAAIRLADVGIGMAARGSTSARSAADLVLSEPDISLVVDALVEGRAMWRRVRDAVAVLVGGNAGEVGFTLLGTALAGHAPINTRQFLVVNMFTDLLPSMALALAPTPTDPDERAALLAGGRPSLGAPLLRDIGLRGAATSVGALAAWLIGRATGPRRRAGTIALASLVGAQLGQTLLLGGRDPLVLATGLGSAAVLAVIIQTPGLSRFFGCIPLDPPAWGVVLGCTVASTAASAALPRLLAQRPRRPAGPAAAGAPLVPAGPVE